MQAGNAGASGASAGTAPSGSGGSGPSAGSGTLGGNAGSGLGSAGSLGNAGNGTGGTGGTTANTTGGSAGQPVAGSSGAGTAAGTGGGMSVGCALTATHTMSEVITTVAAVEWSSDLPNVDSATIEYGLDTNYGMVAPVDLAEPNYRTLLLGMKTEQTYHYRVVANSGATVCMSADQTLETGLRPNAISIPTITTAVPDKLYGGFLLTARWGNNNMGPSFILDKDGDLVWWFYVEDDVIRTRLSFDGKSIWIRNTGQTNGTGIVRRMSLDGLREDRWALPNTTHDLAVMPDGRVGLVGHASSGCDEILIFDPETEMLTSIFNAKEAHGRTTCHVNYLAYSAEDDTFTFSDYEDSSFTKITKSGELVWVLNGTSSDFTGTSWSRQHGIHFIGLEHILIFSNGNPGQNSFVYEYALNTAAKTVTELWSYDTGLQTTNGGDVQRLENGNTIIANSSSGVVREFDSAHTLLQEIRWPVGSTVSYIEKRATLYGGPPPKIYPLETSL